MRRKNKIKRLLTRNGNADLEEVFRRLLKRQDYLWAKTPITFQDMKQIRYLSYHIKRIARFMKATMQARRRNYEAKNAKIY